MSLAVKGNDVTRVNEASATQLLARRSPRFIAFGTWWFWPFARLWFRAKVTGLDRLPPGPVLLVGNHGGFGFGEIGVMLAGWWRHFGNRRVALGLAHALAFIPGLKQFVEACGGIPAEHENGRAALAAGLDVLVFPGGDMDALRPFTQRKQVLFGGRHGFIRLAEEARVPIVPVVTRGSHAQFLFLPGGEAIARALGLEKRFRLKTAPVWPSLLLWLGLLAWAAVGGLAWGWVALGFLAAFFPNPARIHVEIGAPLDVGALLSTSGGSRAEAAQTVRRLMEAALQGRRGSD